MDAKRKLSTKEVADRLSVTRRFVQQLCRKGVIPAMKVGRVWRIDPDYEEVMRKRQQKTAE